MKRITKAQREKFESWARQMGMKPVCVIDDPTCYILVADSGRAVDVYDDEHIEWKNGKLHVHPNAPKKHCYRTAWAFERDGMEFGCWNDYAADEFPMYTENGAQQLRVNEAVKYARLAIEAYDEGKPKMNGVLSVEDVQRNARNLH